MPGLHSVSDPERLRRTTNARKALELKFKELELENKPHEYKLENEKKKYEVEKLRLEAEKLQVELAKDFLQVLNEAKQFGYTDEQIKMFADTILKDKICSVELLTN